MTRGFAKSFFYFTNLVTKVLSKHIKQSQKAVPEKMATSLIQEDNNAQYLSKDRELCFEYGTHNFLNLLVVSWLLPGKLVAGECQDLKPCNKIPVKESITMFQHTCNNAPSEWETDLGFYTSRTKYSVPCSLSALIHCHIHINRI